MAKPNRASQEKRLRERTQKERQQEKSMVRAQRKEARSLRDEAKDSGLDPDLVGIYPGPQPATQD